MNNDTKGKHPAPKRPGRPKAAELRGRQSVRATFKLTEKAIDALSIVSVHLGVKQKSLFEHLLEDIEALEVIAQGLSDDSFKKLNRVQKTFVLSRNTLSLLETTSSLFNTPRDALVEYSIQRLLPVIEEERKKHHHRKELVKDIAAFLNIGKQILDRAGEVLDEEDPVYDRLRGIIAACDNAYRDIATYVDRGDIIEDF